ncbi:MAG: response regulator [Taibaiella sp.]|jgi:two-component system, OmpR family, response regulator|nr:response regulator [Taibaiella sp.]
MSRKIVKKIFVVDDNEMLSMALEDYITRKTMHEVQVYNTGEECLKHLREQPDVVILDFNLNSEDKDAANGMEILQAIKKINKFIHVIMLSSQESYGTALQTINKGAEEYVIKDEGAFEKVVNLIDGLN